MSDPCKRQPGRIIHDEFGPVVNGCRGDYDFTIFFEQIFFELTLSLIIAVICLIRVFLLFKQAKKTAGGFLLYSKSFSSVHVAR